MIRWLTVFLDLEPESYDVAAAFWCAVTGATLSEPRGEYAEFVTLLPPTGDATLRAQRLGEGPSRIHLDLHVDDPRAAADAAVALGAMEVADHGYFVMRSPGGLAFCLVSHHGDAVRPPVRIWPGGQTGGVYQVCLDIPADIYEQESAFWKALLDARDEPLERRREFAWLRPRGELPLDVLLQRLDEPEGDTRAHLDCGSNHRPVEVARHRELGARTVLDEEFWAVMSDPAGLHYCITDRDPATKEL